MFEIGFWELVMVGVVTLLVVGPERLPEVARTAGLWLGRLSRMLATVRAEVDRELQLEELKQSFRQQALQEDLDDLKGLTHAAEALQRDVEAEYDAPLPMPPARMRPSAPEHPAVTDKAP